MDAPDKPTPSTVRLPAELWTLVDRTAEQHRVSRNVIIEWALLYGLTDRFDRLGTVLRPTAPAPGGEPC